MAKTYTVKSGDTLTSISKSTGVPKETIIELNNISNPDLIYVGQVLILEGEPTPVKTNDNTVTITAFGVQSGTTRSIFATWAWTRENTESYKVKWKYRTESNGYWFTGTETEVQIKENIYNAPENAVEVSVIIQPLSKTKTVNNTTTRLWTASWSTEKIHYFVNDPPTKPMAPTVTLDKYQLKAELNNIDINAVGVNFEIIKDNETEPYKTGNATIITNSVSYSCTVDAGSVYKVRCRGYRGTVYGEWSDYSSNVSAAPTAPIINNIEVVTENIIKLTWAKIESAEKYTIEYVVKNKDLTPEECFDAIGSQKVSTTVKVEETEVKDGLVTKTVINLTPGQEYYIRISAANDKSEESNWSEIWPFIVGTTPSSPTTWSSTTTAMVGGSLNLYWTHNSKDNSRITSSELMLYIDGVLSSGSPYIITNEAYEDTQYGIISSPKLKDEENVRICSINTNAFNEGSDIEWKVRTTGVKPNDYGEYSALRKIEIYAPPVLSTSLEDVNNNQLEIIEATTEGFSVYKLLSFPFKIKVSAGNTSNQEPIGYYINIVANENYTTIDDVGNDKNIVKGSNVFSKYYNSTDKNTKFELSANDMILENNITYIVTCTVSMDSGLTAEDNIAFKVAWDEEYYVPYAEIGINKDDVSAYICPRSNGNKDVLLSVYRREFDGSFTEIATDIENGNNTYVTDPHPALDYARYRIIAKSKTTGAVNYSDIPAYPVGEKAVIIQWNDKWQNFDTDNEDELEQQPWSGSLLRLPYNIDVNDKYSPDVSLITYAGRKRPVSYYGTQLGESSSWNVEIPKDDKETLYAIRRLATWMGDVYVREPSGTGYWAQITVNYSQKHREVTIPISFDIKRVEGGV